MRISDWSSDVCSSDLLIALRRSASRLIDTVVAVHCLAHISEVRSASGDRLEADEIGMRDCLAVGHEKGRAVVRKKADALEAFEGVAIEGRSEEQTSELKSLMRISYAVFCLKKKKK